ncbi:MAG: hypothetical protein J5645_09650 [Lachnospiraceae bacterium]|nr:hypothetical protein [Lachnospiraceae bacterium]
MLFAVWSPSYREETAPLAVMIAGMCARQFPCNVAMLENYIHAGNLGTYLLGSRYDYICQSLDRDFGGSYLPGEQFLRHVAHETGRAIVYNTLIQVDGNGLLFMPMNQSLSENAYRYGMYQVIDDRIDTLMNQVDDVVVNLEATGNETTVSLLHRADIVIVCLPATMSAFSSFYDRYRSMLDKCFFVFYGSTPAPEPLLGKIQQFIPRHAMRSCYLEITRLLRRHIEEGHVLDYLDRFGEGKKHVGQVAESAVEYGSQKERESVRTIRYISEWLMQFEYPDAHGDNCLIAQRMLRRRVMPNEVAEWDLMRFGSIDPFTKK